MHGTNVKISDCNVQEVLKHTFVFLRILIHCDRLCCWPWQELHAFIESHISGAHAVGLCVCRKTYRILEVAVSWKLC